MFSPIEGEGGGYIPTLTFPPSLPSPCLPPSPPPSNAHLILGVYVCASRDQQRAGLGVAFRSAQVEGSALALDTRQTDLEGDSHF